MDIQTEASAALMIMMSGKDPITKPLTVTKNGTYNVPSTIDGYNPVLVSVADRYREGYDEGYNDGYTDGDKDGRAAQKKICDEEKVILLERIAELEEEVPEAEKDGFCNDSIDADDDDDLNDILKRLTISNGGSIGVDGTGADTSFRIVEKTLGNGAKYLALVLSSGSETKEVAHTVALWGDGASITWKIESVSFGGTPNRKSVSVKVHGYSNGELVSAGSANLQGYATNVGGTSFGGSNIKTTITKG